MNDSDAVNKFYVDSNVDGLKQDGMVSDTSDIVSLLIKTTNGEVSLPFVLKYYVIIFMYNVKQMKLEFTNNTGNDLWIDCLLVITAKITVTGFFKSFNTGTSSAGTGTTSLPSIGEYYAYIEASAPNYGAEKLANFNIRSIQTFMN